MLLSEVISELHVQDGLVLDGTFGAGGYTRELLRTTKGLAVHITEVMLTSQQRRSLPATAILRRLALHDSLRARLLDECCPFSRDFLASRINSQSWDLLVNVLMALCLTLECLLCRCGSGPLRHYVFTARSLIAQREASHFWSMGHWI